MPFVNLKLVKGQTTPEQRQNIMKGLTDLIVNIMGRERDYTVITIDELEKNQWAIGGKTIEELNDPSRKVSFVNIKISKGTSNPEEMAKMMKETKKLIGGILGNSDETNYFIIDELNPDAWGFDGIPMTIRNKTSK
jgi:4-oxalocrotonate tautomerase